MPVSDPLKLCGTHVPRPQHGAGLHAALKARPSMAGHQEGAAALATPTRGSTAFNIKSSRVKDDEQHKPNQHLMNHRAKDEPHWRR